MSLTSRMKRPVGWPGSWRALQATPMTGAITVALKERLEREARRQSVEERLLRMRAVAQRCAMLLNQEKPILDHGELLYDGRGLPG